MVESALGFLAAADAAGLPGEVQARCLHGLRAGRRDEHRGAGPVLAAFAGARGYCEDGDYSAKMWLFHQTRVTKGCAAGHVGWARRAAAHPRVIAALGAAQVSASWARSICDWTDRLPEECREEADEILLGAAGRGWTCGTWPGWPGRCMRSPGRRTPRTSRAGCSRTGRSGWRPRSAAPGC